VGSCKNNNFLLYNRFQWNGDIIQYRGKIRIKIFFSHFFEKMWKKKFKEKGKKNSWKRKKKNTSQREVKKKKSVNTCRINDCFIFCCKYVCPKCVTRVEIEKKHNWSNLILTIFAFYFKRKQVVSGQVQIFKNRLVVNKF